MDDAAPDTSSDTGASAAGGGSTADGGCGCSTPGTSSRAHGAIALAVLGLVIARGTSRARSSRRSRSGR
ncbi:MAG: MYXO-CTERM sorting domain-containing protein [Polyangiales bacterium]